MKRLPFHKRRLLVHKPYTVIGVDPVAVRDSSKLDEEFGNVAVHADFPRLIPEDEIWIANRVAEEEGVFFAANALARLSALEAGVPEDRAYQTGLNTERCLRAKLRGAEYRGGRPHKRVPNSIYVQQYDTLPDPNGPGGEVIVWLVNGALVRDLYKTDYTEGGHGYVYRWIPRREIWVEATLERTELPYIVAHEYLERLLMRDAGLDYERAHAICSKVEYCLRECREPANMVSGRRKLKKEHLSRLSKPEFYDYVVFRYVRRSG